MFPTLSYKLLAQPAKRSAWWILVLASLMSLADLIFSPLNFTLLPISLCVPINTCISPFSNSFKIREVSLADRARLRYSTLQGNSFNRSLNVW